MTQSPQQIAFTAKQITYIQAGYLTPGQHDSYVRSTSNWESLLGFFGGAASGLELLYKAGVLLQQSIPIPNPPPKTNLFDVQYMRNPAFTFPPGKPVTYPAGTTPY